ncbi:MAG: carbamoyltransferase C-terminal domain-containing protein [Hyphomicrobium sp.]
MNILGLVYTSHDAGLALLTDGKPNIILEEERFNRIKHTLKYPRMSMDAVFGAGGLMKLSDVDVITCPWNMKRIRRSLLGAVFGDMPASLNLLRPEAHRTHTIGLLNVPNRLRLGLWSQFGVGKLPPIVQVGHHESHASVFFVSPFEEATVLVTDGYGDDGATSAWTGRGNKIEKQWSDPMFESLGMLYTCVSEHLGFPFFQEGTVMALAAMGEPAYKDKFKDLIRLLPGGRIQINKDYIQYPTHGLIEPFKPKFYAVFGPRRKSSEPLTQHHHNIAWALQHWTEEALLHMTRELQRVQKSKNLVISGGVALNCVANARILRETDFERVWVPPVASDTGVCFGSALYHWHNTLGNTRDFELTHAFYGKGFSDGEITAALDAAGLKYERMEEGALLKRVAQDLADMRIVGWFQGRAEIGPRALGNRSILSSATTNKMKDLINARIKHREAFRPFAPVVLIERLNEFFEYEHPDPFMTVAPMIRKDKVALIPAAAHVDGTGRIQTIDRKANPRYYGVIEEYAKITGIPVILNTSFNRQEPVVNAPAEAISCYLRTDMDRLVLGDFYITDRNEAAVNRAFAAFDKAA